jgi:predicted Zn-dependent peptidase
MITKTFTLLFSLFLLSGGNFGLRAQERFRKSPPNPDPLPELNLPQIQTAVLSNGLTIHVVNRRNSPVMTLRLMVLAGENCSPENFPGTATFTANILSRRTLRHSADEIEERIEAIGGNLSISTHPDYSMFTFSFLEEFLDEGLSILSELILQPSITRREMDNVIRSMYYDLLERISDPEIIARRQLFHILFKDHPYEKSLFHQDVIKNITQENLLSLLEKYYIPNNAHIILTGNLTLSIASRKVSSYFNTWERKEKEFIPVSFPEPVEKKKICFVDLPNERDATIFMGNVMVPLSSQDFFPLIVLNQVLGGTATSRLFMNLRESKGYAYYAFSDLELFKACGVFLVRAKVRPEVTHSAVMDILLEMTRITEEKIPNFEIEQAKSYLIGNFPLNIETLNNLSLKVARIISLQLGEEHWNKYYENIMLIDADKVSETARKYPLLTPVVVIVGDKDILLSHLSEFEVVEVYDNKGALRYSMKKEILDGTG